MDQYGGIGLTIIEEQEAMAVVPFPAPLDSDKITLARITANLSRGCGGVLLQGIVNWSAVFTVPSVTSLASKGFAEVTFQILRDDQVIYAVTQTIRQKNFSVSGESQTKTTFELATLLHLDKPRGDEDGPVTYTLRAADIALFPQSAIVAGKDTPAVSAAIGSVTFVAQTLDSGIGCTLENENDEAVVDGMAMVVISENEPMLRSTIPFPILLSAEYGSDLALANIEIGPKDGSLILAVVNWVLRVSSETKAVPVTSSGLAHVTFELLRNDTVICSTTQTAVQTFVSGSMEPTEAATFKTVAISYLDIPPERQKSEIYNYVLRAGNVNMIPPLTATDGELFSSVSVGSVTLVGQELESQNVKKKTKKGRR